MPPEEILAAFESLEKKERAKSPSWIGPLRRGAISRFTEIGFPTPQDEDWKYTNVTPFVKNPLRFVSEPYSNGLRRDKTEGFLVGKTSGPLLVFVNGFYSKKLSREGTLPKGSQVGSLGSALRENPELVKPYLARVASYEKNGFTALNTAFLQDGAFVYLAKGTVMEDPIQFLFLSLASEENSIFQPRNLVIAEKGSRATLTETYVSLSKAPYFTNAVTELVIAEGAAIDHYKIQREEKSGGRHVATTEVRLKGNSRFFSFSLSLGARFGRENLNVLLDAERAECSLNGLYLVSEGRHIDHHTRIDHFKPRGTSRQLYKGIVEGKSTAVFNGKIFVHKDAAKTDAEQTNKNLLLSDDATVDAKPQLEIYTDDVKCTHGAAVGQLDQDQLFYLRSRGLDEEKAKDILTYAFVSEVIQRAGAESLRAGLDQLVWSWLKRDEAREVSA